jgi:alkaline phosphatase D
MLNPAGLYDRVLRQLSRRDLMKAAWVLGASAVALPVEARRQGGVSMFFNAYPFSLGVASGDPLPDGIVLWTRLAPQPLTGGGMPMVPVNVQWELASDSAFRTIVQKGESLARPELGHSVHVEVSGLQPAHDYWYRFRAGNEVSQVGRTRTAPAAGAAVDRLRFGICGCGHYETGHFTGYRRIAQEQFDFVIHTGDYIYEGRADGGRTEGAVRQHTGDEIYTLVDYRNRYGLYKSAGTTTRSRTTMPASSTRTARRRRSSCCGAPPRIRPTTSTCRSGRRPGRPARTCASTGGCSSAASSI